MISEVIKRTNYMLKGDEEESSTSRPAERSASAPASKSVSRRSAPSGAAYFSEDVEFKGTLCFGSSMEINGRFEGEIVADGDLIIGENALIKADIIAPAVKVKGKVQGNIVAKDRVELLSGAHLYGDVRTPKFVLSEGVTFVGSSDTLDGGKPETDFSSMFTRLTKVKKDQPAAQ